LRATESEKAVALHAKHHDQVQSAVTAFWKTIQQELADARTVESKRNPQEQKAVAFLNTVIKLPNASAEEKQLCAAAIHAIGKARFQPLARDIAKLLNSQKTKQVHTSILVERLMALIGKYPLILDDEDGPGSIAIRRQETAASPDIIISESFS
jgi:superoxide dismutase